MTTHGMNQQSEYLEQIIQKWYSITIFFFSSFSIISVDKELAGAGFSKKFPKHDFRAQKAILLAGFPSTIKVSVVLKLSIKKAKLSGL